MIQSLPRCDDDGADGNGDATRKRIMSGMYDDGGGDDGDRRHFLMLQVYTILYILCIMYYLFDTRY